MRKPLNRDAILDKAVELLDRDGMEALSMRKLGTALGVEAMSLYNHIPSKAALLDGIHERILLSLDPPPNARSWQTFARHQAHALHRALVAHPNAITLFATRPASTPAAIEQLDRYLVVMRKAGFKPFQALSVVQLTAQLVVGHVMWTTGIESIELAHETAPATLDVGMQHALDTWDPDRELELGIDALLHGFERLLT
jgi:TetR/AcrR family transcriptional regulator, tetracycline repressor protein